MILGWFHESLNLLRAYLLKTPPKRDAFKHSGGESRRWTSATVTLYLDVELNNESLPGTEQKTSPGIILRWCIPWPSLDDIPCGWPWCTDPTWEWWWWWTIPAAWWAWWATEVWSRERIPRKILKKLSFEFQISIKIYKETFY